MTPRKPRVSLDVSCSMTVRYIVFLLYKISSMRHCCVSIPYVGVLAESLNPEWICNSFRSKKEKRCDEHRVSNYCIKNKFKGTFSIFPPCLQSSHLGAALDSEGDSFSHLLSYSLLRKSPCHLLSRPLSPLSSLLCSLPKNQLQRENNLKNPRSVKILKLRRLVIQRERELK